MTRDMDIIRLGAEMSELVYPGSELPSPNVRVMTRGGGATFKPYFYVAKNSNDLIITVRGAAEPGDFLLVLDFTRVDFAGGKAHKGVLEAARWIIDQARKYIDECTGKIVCCGHSLGGATSAMIAAVLTLEEKRKNVFAVSIAPFPILTQDLCQQIEPYVTSFAFRNDVVPKLSAKNTGLIVKSFVPVGSQNEQAKQMLQGIAQNVIYGILQVSGFADQTTIREIQNQLPQITDRLIACASTEEKYEFFLPGKAYYLNYDQNGIPYARPYTEQDGIFNISVLMVGISDHGGENYNDIIYSLEQLD
ncbi:hypothetical protein M9Y10_012448 [Tritrichomonas musculus]|uniref:Fungal lipase-type domain-containing protein n=1 Tax=Tritrichomonas musculus TaxID=1915356 RepID=A0ABR2IDD3_9EUKA